MNTSTVMAGIILGLIFVPISEADTSLQVREVNVPEYYEMYKKASKLESIIIETVSLMKVGSEGWRLVSTTRYVKKNLSDKLPPSESLSNRLPKIENLVPSIPIITSIETLDIISKMNTIKGAEFNFSSIAVLPSSILEEKDLLEGEGRILKYVANLDLDLMNKSYRVVNERWFGSKTGFRYLEKIILSDGQVLALQKRIPRLATDKEIDRLQLDRASPKYYGSKKAKKIAGLKRIKASLESAGIDSDLTLYILEDLGYGG